MNVREIQNATWRKAENPVEVVGSGTDGNFWKRTYANMREAQKTWPSMTLEGMPNFFGPMKGVINGQEGCRFETRAAYQILST